MPAHIRAGMQQGAHGAVAQPATESAPRGQAAPSTDWQVPFSPNLLPHPVSRPAPAPPGEAGAPAEEQRSGLAKHAITAAIAGGLLQNVIDVGRLVKKFPEAQRRGVLGLALRQTALTAPDSRIIDPVAPRIAGAASGGKSFTHFDEAAMKTSVFLGATISAVQFASSIPNLVDAIGQEGGLGNLGQTTSGRAGVLQFLGGGLGLGMFGAALVQTRGVGGNVVERVVAAGKAPIMANPLLKQVGIASGVLVLANELGYFDFWNRDDSRSVPTVLRDAVHGTAVLNDGGLRTAALVGAGGVIGWNGARAVQAAGSLSGLTRGHAIGGAIVGGLLGAQLLGALDVFDAPDAGQSKPAD